MYSKSDLKADLTAMGLKGSETVIIHSSLKSIGEVENRADGILDALVEFFKDGLLVFPSMSYNLVNAKQPVFSVRDTPCCVSMLPELFRRRPGVIRSLHPTHAVAAIGKDAAEFVAGHEKFDSPAHPESPWGKLYKRNAVILFVGTGTIHCNTYLHGVEEWLPVPGMLTDYHEPLVVYDYEFLLISKAGNIVYWKAIPFPAVRKIPLYPKRQRSPGSVSRNCVPDLSGRLLPGKK